MSHSPSVGRSAGRFAVTVAGALGSLVLVASPALALCGEGPGFEPLVRTSRAVWLGTVAGVEDGCWDSCRLRVRVERVLKGPRVDGSLAVLTAWGGPRTSDPEATPFDGYLGERYVLTLEKVHGRWVWARPGGDCGEGPLAQTSLTAAERVLGVKPSGSGDEPFPWIAVGSGVAVALLAGGVLAVVLVRGTDRRSR